MADSIKKLIQSQQKSYNEVFKKHPKTFHQPTFHYDWWMFPMKVPADASVSDTTRSFSITDKETQYLLTHTQFIQTYQNSIDKYLANLQKYGWNDYDIRYAKMVDSLAHFIAASDAYIIKLNATKIVNVKDLVEVNSHLKKSANIALRFAKKNIPEPSPFLKNGLRKLNKLVKPGIQFKMSVPPSDSRSAMIGGIAGCLGAIVIAMIYNLPLLFVGLGSLLIATAAYLTYHRYAKNDGPIPAKIKNIHGSFLANHLESKTLTPFRTGSALSNRIDQHSRYDKEVGSHRKVDKEMRLK